MELTMKQLLASPSLQLVTYPASATAQSAEFASADCVTGLNEIGQISVSNISGDPQDVERIVALKADEQGASWYRIITMYEDQQPDNWRVQAILYAHQSYTLTHTLPPSPAAINHSGSALTTVRRRAYLTSPDTTPAPLAERHISTFAHRSPAGIADE